MQENRGSPQSLGTKAAWHQVEPPARVGRRQGNAKARGSGHPVILAPLVGHRPRRLALPAGAPAEGVGAAAEGLAFAESPPHVLYLHFVFVTY